MNKVHQTLMKMSHYAKAAETISNRYEFPRSSDTRVIRHELQNSYAQSILKLQIELQRQSCNKSKNGKADFFF